jgi:hypothetical protein
VDTSGGKFRTTPTGCVGGMSTKTKRWSHTVVGFLFTRETPAQDKVEEIYLTRIRLVMRQTMLLGRYVSDVLMPAVTEALDRQQTRRRLSTKATAHHHYRTSAAHTQHSVRHDLLNMPEHTPTVLLPDQVTAVWGAQHHNSLPVDKDPHRKTFLNWFG